MNEGRGVCGIDIDTDSDSDKLAKTLRRNAVQWFVEGVIIVTD